MLERTEGGWGKSEPDNREGKQREERKCKGRERGTKRENESGNRG